MDYVGICPLDCLLWKWWLSGIFWKMQRCPVSKNNPYFPLCPHCVHNISADHPVLYRVKYLQKLCLPSLQHSSVDKTCIQIRLSLFLPLWNTKVIRTFPTSSNKFKYFLCICMHHYNTLLMPSSSFSPIIGCCLQHQTISPVFKHLQLAWSTFGRG